ncbi:MULTISPECIES: IS3 family transposase [Candidatus Phytoplasma]|uniref:Transposase n=3 Tax=Candidatus Phytoplasma TaxID=33926 RepID=Q7X4S7_PEWBP|nr:MULTISPECIES: IS3 family transposase [Phytoplasma]AAP44299.1 transposase [Peanut witches'-broom phytoplasma]QLL36869.1 putative transposase ['Echinacea purpurea' witches'-broom phytoplasma]WKV64117.1 MAG: putative transposase [Candidatus Phytoplasma australasiaticum]EMR14786.1 putative transposase [Peanut witches'-broom phytoplasma NTU2011]MDO8052639.1 IS3 family transposase ['Vigna radiata' phytoplasma]
MQKLKQKIELLQKMMEKIKKIDKKMVFYLVNQFQQTLNLTTILQTIRINRSTYYYWLKVQNKLKEKEEKYLLQQKRIKTLCLNYQYFYGHRKITDLYQKTFNEKISKKKVYIIMKKNDIRCRLRIKKIFTYCNLKNNLQIIPNLINQDFMTTKPLQKLFTDITYFKTKQGFLYFSCIIDAFNNQIIASHVSNQQNQDLVLKTIKKLPQLKAPCIMHSDQGMVYQTKKIQQTLRKKGFLISMSRKANPRDNAVIENFFGQMKTILQYQQPFLLEKSPNSMKKIINHFPRFWNTQWILKKLNYATPIQYAQNRS